MAQAWGSTSPTVCIGLAFILIYVYKIRDNGIIYDFSCAIN